MKRRDLVRHLEQQGCELLREGGNRESQKTEDLNRSTPPRN